MVTVYEVLVPWPACSPDATGTFPSLSCCSCLASPCPSYEQAALALENGRREGEGGHQPAKCQPYLRVHLLRASLQLDVIPSIGHLIRQHP